MFNLLGHLWPWASKRAYLTIDDGPTGDRRRKVDVLAERGVRGLWFCVGRDLEHRPDDAVYTIQCGGVIGNHSYSHPHFSKIDLGRCAREIERTDRLIDEVYDRANTPRPMKAFRFPYGDKGGSHDYFGGRPYTERGLAKKNEIQEILRANGYGQPELGGVRYAYYRRAGLLADADWYWTYDALEWNLALEEPLFGIKTVGDVLRLMGRDAPENWAGLNHKGSADIVLVHDHADERTTGAFVPIIDRLLAKKIVFDPIPT